MKVLPASALAELEAAKHQYGPGCAVRVEKLLVSLRKREFSGAESLIRFHDALLFLRAFPQSRKVVALAEELLDAIGQQVTKLCNSGADTELFNDEEFSGIAGTVVREGFTYEVASWLARHYPQHIQAEWDLDEQAWQMSSSLPQLLPLLADDCFVEADTPYLSWLSAAAGGQERILPWLLRRLEDAQWTMLQKTAWYDALKIDIAWEMRDLPISRTRARCNPPAFYYHKAALLRRNQVSLDDEFHAAPLSVRRLSRNLGTQVLDFARAALTVRYRELYGSTRGDPTQAIEADAGRGVRIYLWGLPPDRRLPLRAYHAGFTTKNGVPVNYFEAISLCEWAEVGFNTYYAFRDGETAWIYSKVLHLLHQASGVTCFSVYPYQLGADNEEAIKSGAFWFYRKLGFRPGQPELLAITKREEAKIAATAGYRTSARTLRKLAAGHVFYEIGDGPQGLWDNFSTRKLGIAVQQHMARKFKGDPIKMRQETTALVAQILRVDLTRWKTDEEESFANFASVLALVPDLARWTNAEKQAVTQIIREKTAADETNYLHLMRGHCKLKAAILSLGSAPMPDDVA